MISQFFYFLALVCALVVTMGVVSVLIPVAWFILLSLLRILHPTRPRQEPPCQK